MLLHKEANRNWETVIFQKLKDGCYPIADISRCGGVVISECSVRSQKLPSRVLIFCTPYFAMMIKIRILRWTCEHVTCGVVRNPVVEETFAAQLS